MSPRPHEKTANSSTWTLAAAMLASLAATACGGDWPQILGPLRNGLAENERLADRWPNDGPKVAWQREVGRGFAGVAVADGKLILFHRVDMRQIAEALAAATGKLLWKVDFPTDYRSTIAEDDGPRCVPVMHRDRVILFGADGELICLALADGKTLWIRHTQTEFEPPDSYFGAGSTPLVEGDKVLVNVGGRGGAGLVAFSLADGKTVWQTANDAASYAAPTVTTVAGQRHVIFVTRLAVVSVDPDTGRERFRFRFGKVGPTVNAATPLVCDGKLFVTASYNIGGVMSKLHKDRVERLWAHDDVLSSQYTTSVYLDGHLYGVDGRADLGGTELRCVDAATGRVVWSEKDYGVAHLIHADQKLLALKDDGTLALATVSPRGYHELAKAKVLETTTRALPALAHGRLYVRDTRVLKCLDVGRP